MIRSHRHLAWSLCLLLAAGCATTKVTDRKIDAAANTIAKPDRILVYDFVGSPQDMPADSTFAGQVASHDTSQTDDQIALGRRVGSELAAALVEEIRAMGLPGVRAVGEPAPRLNDVIIRGYLVSTDAGSETKRLLIGFGSGSAEMSAAVEGFQVTPTGMRKLGSGTVDASGGKSPGAAVPIAVTIATANPIGLIVSSGVKVYGEVSGKDKIEGRVRDAAKEIAAQIRPRAIEAGWIKD